MDMLGSASLVHAGLTDLSGLEGLGDHLSHHHHAAAAAHHHYYAQVSRRFFTFLLSKARQAKTEHTEMKILQPIFGILVTLTKNVVTKICNELGNLAIY